MKVYQKILLAVFFIVIIFQGVIIHDDIGVSWDEPEQRKIGYTFYDYIFNDDETLNTSPYQFYGAFVETSLVIAENVFNAETSAEIFRLRHLILHLFFVFGLFGFFLLVYKLFGNYYLALLGVVILILSPRIFAHSFMNSKDTPLMVMFIWALLSLYNLAKNLNIKNLIIHSFVTALLINIRITGFVFPLLTIAYFFVDVFKQDFNLKKYLKYLALYTVLSFVFLLIIWPALWNKPFASFAHAIYRMAWFPFSLDIFYGGEFYKCKELPWHYLFGMFVKTTPVFYLLLFLGGIIEFIRDLFKNFNIILENRKYRFAAINADFSIGFILVLIILNSCVYDSWRHVQFLYPSFLITGLYFLNSLLQYSKENKIFRYLFIAFTVIPLLFIAIDMYKLHPNNQVYFNSFVKTGNNNIRKNYEMDYWGVSQYQGLKYIIENDSSEAIKIKSNLMVGNNAKLLFDEATQQPLIITDGFTFEESDYFITNYRWHPEDYNIENKVFSLKYKGNEYLTVYKLK